MAVASASSSIVSECFVVQSPVTSQDGVFVGRNAYRPADEAVEVVYFAADASAPATQKCTTIELPGTGTTHAVILNRPAGIWGADSGANEKRVSVAVTWSHEADGQLTATDLTRLALERAATAEEAVTTIGGLVEEHHAADVAALQQCFVIAGEKEAWLLNVAGNVWAAERIEDGFRPIGAGLSVSGTPTLNSAGLQAKALDLALWNGTDPFDFAAVFQTEASSAVSTGAASGAVAAPSSDKPFGLLDMFGLLRDAASATGDAHPSGLPPSASQVTAIGIDGGGSTPVTCHWFTATPNPAESVYKPFVFTRNVRISPLTMIDAGGDGETAAASAGDSGSGTRLHRLHAQRNGAKVGVLLRSLEESCVQEVHNFLSASEAPVQELDELLKDCVEAEVKFYR